MPYEVFAEKIKVLSPRYYEQLMDYLEFLIAKSQASKNTDVEETVDWDAFVMPCSRAENADEYIRDLRENDRF